MFTAPTTPGLASQPRKGLGARVAGGFSRLGAALRGAVAGGLRRPRSGPDSQAASDVDRISAAGKTRAPRRPRRRRTGVLTRLFDRGRPIAVAPQPSGERPDFDFSREAFPELTPEARAFFNTPLEDCDPEMLGVVLEVLAEQIARAMTPQEGAPDVRDVFLTLSSRMAAVRGEAEPTPPTAPPEEAGAPAHEADAAAIDSRAASPDVPRAAPACDPAAPQSEGTTVAQGGAAPASAVPEYSAAAVPVELRRSDAKVDDTCATVDDTCTQEALVPNSRRVPWRQMRCGSFRVGPGLATRGIMLLYRNILARARCVVRPPRRPPRLLCYAACAGP